MKDGPSKCKDLGEKLAELCKEAGDKVKDAKAEAEAAGLSGMDTLKAVGESSKNLSTLTKGLPKVKLLAEALI